MAAVETRRVRKRSDGLVGRPNPPPGRRFELPASNATDGNMLAKLVWHSVVRDMIIRADTWFPRYGIQGQWSYGAKGNDNCDITLRSSMELALEIGAFDFARGVLENFFRCKCSRFLCVFFRSSKQRLHSCNGVGVFDTQTKKWGSVRAKSSSEGCQRHRRTARRRMARH